VRDAHTIHIETAARIPVAILLVMQLSNTLALLSVGMTNNFGNTNIKITILVIDGKRRLEAVLTERLVDYAAWSES
jgi:hypothetical protein